MPRRPWYCRLLKGQYQKTFSKICSTFRRVKLLTFQQFWPSAFAHAYTSIRMLYLSNLELIQFGFSLRAWDSNSSKSDLIETKHRINRIFISRLFLNEQAKTLNLICEPVICVACRKHVVIRTGVTVKPVLHRWLDRLKIKCTNISL